MSYPPPNKPDHQPQPVITQPQPLPIVTQPTAGHGQAQEQGQPSDGWMAIPAQVPSNFPPDLQYLATVDQLIVKKEKDLFEVLAGYEKNDRYTIKDKVGKNVFFGVEISDWLTRCCHERMRAFDIKILNILGNEIIHLHRNYNCVKCCYPCCLQKLEVFSPPGVLVGTVEQQWAMFSSIFNVKNETGHTVLKIKGPVCQYLIYCAQFNVLSLDKSAVVGKISKQSQGLLPAFFKDIDYFGITFPLDLDIRMKAVLIGACFLIHFIYFDDLGRRDRDDSDYSDYRDYRDYRNRRYNEDNWD